MLSHCINSTEFSILYLFEIKPKVISAKYFKRGIFLFLCGAFLSNFEQIVCIKVQTLLGFTCIRDVFSKE